MMVGRWVSFWEGLFSGSMLNFRGAYSSIFWITWYLKSKESSQHSMGFSTRRLISIATFPKTNSFDLVVARLQPWCLKHVGDLLEKENLHCTKNGLPDRKYLWLEGGVTSSGISIFVNVSLPGFFRRRGWSSPPPSHSTHGKSATNKSHLEGEKFGRKINGRFTYVVMSHPHTQCTMMCGVFTYNYSHVGKYTIHWLSCLCHMQLVHLKMTWKKIYTVYVLHCINQKLRLCDIYCRSRDTTNPNNAFLEENLRFYHTFAWSLIFPKWVS